MAVSKAKIDEIPQDAVILSEEEALIYQWKIIQKWDKSSEIWSLRYSSGILGGLSAATGVYINNHYRKKLKLGNYGRLSTYLPIVVLPAIMTTILHKHFVQKDVILNTRICPLCIGGRASLIQIGFGIIYPSILAPFASFMFATRHYTYNLPSITQNPKEVFLLWKKFTKPILYPIGVAAVLHAIVGMYLTQKQFEHCWVLNKKLHEIEKLIDSS